MLINKTQKKNEIECARAIADWLCMVQYPTLHTDARSGTFSWVVGRTGKTWLASNWNLAFAIMGLLAANKAFNETRYEKAALKMGRYLKTLQIFEPFNLEHYGAIREMSPQTSWCYTRDSLSAAWSFVELYRHTGEKEYLERAVLWGEWFLRKGCDEDGWPLWGHQFEPCFMVTEAQMCNDVQGCFQGGSLNFFYQLAQVTKDDKWIGDFYVKMADFFTEHIQQPSGMFTSIERKTKLPVAKDPQNGLHKANDDLGTLGLLCAYRVTGNERYLESIKKFLNAVFKGQDKHGNFDNTAASIPIVLNILYETRNLIEIPLATNEKVKLALRELMNRQDTGLYNPLQRGGIIEELEGDAVCSRSSCYALIFLLKQFSGVSEYLSGN